jgi:hypothetical protein
VHHVRSKHLWRVGASDVAPGSRASRAYPHDGKETRELLLSEPFALAPQARLAK